MIQEAKNSMTLQKGLEYRFLYHDDPTSIHLLLALLENDMKIKRLKPKYMCMKALKRSLGRIFAHREDKHEMAAAIYKSINNDINRLELAIYLESYAFGYKDLQWVNMLEAAAIKSIPIEELYNRNVLFHTNMNNEALVVKNRLLVYLDADKEKVSDYCKKLRDEIVSIGFNPKSIIIPISAKPARLFKMAIKGKSLNFTQKEKNDFITDISLLLEDNSIALASDIKASCNDTDDSSIYIENKSFSRNQLRKALYNTGLPNVEKALEMIAANLI